MNWTFPWTVRWLTLNLLPIVFSISLRKWESDFVMNRTGKASQTVQPGLLFRGTAWSIEFLWHTRHSLLTLEKLKKVLVWFVRHEILNSRLLQPTWSWSSVGIKDKLAKEGISIHFLKWRTKPVWNLSRHWLGWAEHYQWKLEKVRIISEGLQEIEERHFELLIYAGMAERYCWLDMFLNQARPK